MEVIMKKYKKFLSFVFMFVFIFGGFLTKEAKMVEASNLQSIEEYDNYVKNNLDVLAEDKVFSKVETLSGEKNDLILYTYEMEPVILQTRSVDSDDVMSAKTVLFRAGGGSKEDYGTDGRNVIMGSVTIYYTMPSDNYACLTQITGYYKYVGDSSGIIIKSQNVSYGLYGFNQNGQWVNYKGDIPLNSYTPSFSRNTGYTDAVNLYGEHNVGATYMITLRQPAYGDEWTLRIANSL